MKFDRNGHRFLSKHACFCVLGVTIASIILPCSGTTQDSKQPPVQTPAPQQNSPAPANALSSLQLDPNVALHHLNQVINWYRHSTTNVRSVGLPSDAIYEDNAKNLGAQVVKLAFQSAKAESAIISAPNTIA